MQRSRLARVVIAALVASGWGVFAGAETIPGSGMSVNDAGAATGRPLHARRGTLAYTSGGHFRINNGVVGGPLSPSQPRLVLNMSVAPDWTARTVSGLSLRDALTAATGDQDIFSEFADGLVPFVATLDVTYQTLDIVEVSREGMFWPQSTISDRQTGLQLVLFCDRFQRVHHIINPATPNAEVIRAGDPIELSLGEVYASRYDQSARALDHNLQDDVQTGELEVFIDRLRFFDLEYSGPFWPQGEMRLTTQEQ